MISNDKSVVTLSDHTDVTSNDNSIVTSNDNSVVTPNDNRVVTSNDHTDVTTNDNTNVTPNDNFIKNISIYCTVTQPHLCIKSCLSYAVVLRPQPTNRGKLRTK